MSNKYEKLFVILDEDDMQSLKDGTPIFIYDDENSRPLCIFTEESYKKWLLHWGEIDDAN